MDQQTNDLINNEITANEVCLFMKGTPDAPQCGFSMAVSNILKILEVNFKGVNVLENQNAYFYLDSKPITIHSKNHRPAYSSDGDYFSKPNCENIFDRIYSLFNELNPKAYPSLR